MYENIEPILNALNETPRILNELISEINSGLYKKEIVSGKWTIHEHATHVAMSDLQGFQKRLVDFKEKEKPAFTSLSGSNFHSNYYLNLNLEKTVEDFFKVRQQTIDFALSLTDKDWNKEAIHSEYEKYTPNIMLRHLLMHDHNHLYKIEDMGFGIGHVK
ncbi:DinB superfamily protein [Tenacibaculum sp. MAR_2009_124]|uniref:DinB family protein n=1 Tax=Tenacibaculum sp. MAR_2009_124 TaxID=1250059 RepID=UPI00089CD922|nr:DinB family protein [Tenacibaculum sp. MAR_2009_124]SEB36075.1 DinB superfamily protein [Tenacibaculum sp. MAR_2009_124]